MKKTLFTLLCIIVVHMSLHAIPAQPGLVNSKLPNGKSIEFYIRGDERINWLESVDGYTLLLNAQQQVVYATLDGMGNMIPSSYTYQGNSQNRTITLSPPGIPKGLFYSKSQTDIFLQAWDVKEDVITKSSSANNPNEGKVKVLCILVDFEDRPMTIPNAKEEFEKLLNQKNYAGYKDCKLGGSVADYFNEISYGKFNVEFKVVGPYRAGKMSEYVNIDSNIKRTYLDRLGTWLIKNKISNEPGLDLSEFVGARAGIIDRTHIIFAGEGQSSNPNGFIWPHQAYFPRGGMPTPPNREDFACNNPKDGKKYYFEKYSCSDELVEKNTDDYSGKWRDREKYYPTIGTACHELAHLLLDSRDYYDTSSGSGYYGTGSWDLMGSGCYNFLEDDDLDEDDNFRVYGSCPAHINMFEKIRLGWVEKKFAYKTGDFKLKNSVENPEAYIISFDPSVTGEYDVNRPLESLEGDLFILENKQRKGFERGQVFVGDRHDGGLLIYRMSGAEMANNSKWYVNYGYPQRFYPVCATSPYTLPGKIEGVTTAANSYGYLNNKESLFGNEKNEFTNETTPSTRYPKGGYDVLNETYLDISPGPFGLVNIKNENEEVTFRYVSTKSPIEITISSQVEYRSNPYEAKLIEGAYGGDTLCYLFPLGNSGSMTMQIKNTSIAGNLSWSLYSDDRFPIGNFTGNPLNYTRHIMDIETDAYWYPEYLKIVCNNDNSQRVVVFKRLLEYKLTSKGKKVFKKGERITFNIKNEGTNTYDGEGIDDNWLIRWYESPNLKPISGWLFMATYEAIEDGLAEVEVIIEPWIHRPNNVIFKPHDKLYLRDKIWIGDEATSPLLFNNALKNTILKQEVGIDNMSINNDITISIVNGAIKVSSESEIKEVNVYTLSGVLVKSLSPKATEAVVKDINYTSGVYIVKVVSETSQKTQKFVVR